MTSRSTFPEVKIRVDRALGWVVTAVMGVAVVNVLWQVFTRYVLESPSPYTDELARYLLIWIGLLGASYAAGQRLHLAIDLLPARLTGKAREALGLVIDLLVFLFAFFVMVFGGLRLVALTLQLQQTSAALRVPLGYVYMVLPISGALIMFYSAFFMVDRLRVLRGERPLLVETDRQSAAAFAEEVNAVQDSPPDELSATAAGSGRDRGAGEI